MASVGEAVIKLRADSSGVTAGISQAKSQLQGLNTAVSQVGRGAAQAAGETGRAFSGLSGVLQQTKGFALDLRSSILSVAAGVGAANLVARAFNAVQQAVVGFNSTQEQALIGFKTMLGSQAAANKLMADLKQFAATTPFEFQSLIGTAQQMMALGFQGKNLIPSLTAIGDAVAALGGGPVILERVVRALGQMQAKGKLSAQEMRQLAEAGIPAWKFLAEAIGTDIPNAMKMAEKGLIDSKTAIDAILEGSTKQFGGMMQAQSKTLMGAMSNVVDFITQKAASASMPIYDALRDGILSISKWMQGPQAQAIGEGISNVIQSALEGTGQIIEKFIAITTPFWDAVGDAISKLGPTIENVMSALKPFAALLGGAVIGSLAAIVAAATPLLNLLAGLARAVGENRAAMIALITVWAAWRTFQTGGWLSELQAGFAKLTVSMRNHANNVTGFFNQFRTGVLRGTQGVTQSFAGMTTQLGQSVRQTASGLTVVDRSFTQATGNMASGAAAAGGVITKAATAGSTALKILGGAVPVLGTIAVTAGMIGLDAWMQSQAEKARFAAQAWSDMINLMKQFGGDKITTTEGMSALIDFIQNVKEGELDKRLQAVHLNLVDVARGFVQISTGVDTAASKWGKAFVHLNDEMVLWKRSVGNSPAQFKQVGQSIAEAISEGGAAGAFTMYQKLAAKVTNDDSLKKVLLAQAKAIQDSAFLRDIFAGMRGQKPDDILAFLVSIDDLLEAEGEGIKTTEAFREAHNKLAVDLKKGALGTAEIGKNILDWRAGLQASGVALAGVDSKSEEAQKAIENFSQSIMKALDPLKKLDLTEAIGLNDFAFNLANNQQIVQQWGDQINQILRSDVLDPSTARDVGNYFRSLGAESSGKLVDEFVNAAPEKQREIAAAIQSMFSTVEKLQFMKGVGDKLFNMDDLTQAIRSGVPTISLASMIGVKPEELMSKLDEIDPVLAQWARDNDSQWANIGGVLGQGVIKGAEMALGQIEATTGKQFGDIPIGFKVGTTPEEIKGVISKFFSSLPPNTFQISGDTTKMAQQFAEGAFKAAKDLQDQTDFTSAPELGQVRDAYADLFKWIDDHRLGKNKPLVEQLLDPETTAEAQATLLKFLQGDYVVTIKTELQTALAETTLANVIDAMSTGNWVKVEAVMNTEALNSLHNAILRGDWDSVLAILADPTSYSGTVKQLTDNPPSTTIPVDADITRAINTIRSLTGITVTANVIAQVHAATENPNVGPGFDPNLGGFTSADGNIFEYYANGGENHTAQIARNSVRVWAEPETGGEAYIPLALAKRARSVKILKDVMRRFGMGPGLSFAEGGTYNYYAANNSGGGGGENFNFIVVRNEAELLRKVPPRHRPRARALLHGSQR